MATAVPADQAGPATALVGRETDRAAQVAHVGLQALVGTRRDRTTANAGFPCCQFDRATQIILKANGFRSVTRSTARA
jgi:hypothetical protein